MTIVGEPLRMNRRRILRTVGVTLGSLGGCAGSRPIRSGTRTTSRTTSSPAEDGHRTIAAIAIRTGNLSEIDLEPSVEILESAVTDERAGKLELSLTNESDRQRTLAYEPCPPADEHTASRVDGDANLVLLRSDEQDFDPASEECWRLSEMDFFVGEPCGPAELAVDADETLTRTYELWDHPKNERCMPPGEYRFGETYRIGRREFEWWFVVRVDEP